MANISQNVNIEMLEKLPDGTYKRKYPKTRADDGTTFDEHLAESMPHQFVDGAKTYRWGFRTKNGMAQFIYEEVI